MSERENLGNFEGARIYRELSGGVWLEVVSPIDCGVKLSVNWRDIWGKPHGWDLDVDEESARAFAESILTAIADDSTSTERPKATPIGITIVEDGEGRQSITFAKRGDQPAQTIFVTMLLHQLAELSNAVNQKLPAHDEEMREHRDALHSAREFICKAMTILKLVAEGATAHVVSDSDYLEQAKPELIKLLHDLDRLRGPVVEFTPEELRSVASRAHEFITSGETLRGIMKGIRSDREVELEAMLQRAHDQLHEVAVACDSNRTSSGKIDKIKGVLKAPNLLRMSRERS